MTAESRMKNLVAARRLAAAINADCGLASGKLKDTLREASEAMSEVIVQLEDSFVVGPITSPMEAVMGALLLSERSEGDAKSEEDTHDNRTARLAESLLQFTASTHNIDVERLGVRSGPESTLADRTVPILI